MRWKIIRTVLCCSVLQLCAVISTFIWAVLIRLVLTSVYLLSVWVWLSYLFIVCWLLASVQFIASKTRLRNDLLCVEWDSTQLLTWGRSSMQLQLQLQLPHIMSRTVCHQHCVTAACHWTRFSGGWRLIFWTVLIRTSPGAVVALLCDSGVSYKCNDLLTYLLT